MQNYWHCFKSGQCVASYLSGWLPLLNIPQGSIWINKCPELKRKSIKCQPEAESWCTTALRRWLRRSHRSRKMRESWWLSWKCFHDVQNLNCWWFRWMLCSCLQWVCPTMQLGCYIRYLREFLPAFAWLSGFSGVIPQAPILLYNCWCSSYSHAFRTSSHLGPVRPWLHWLLPYEQLRIWCWERFPGELAVVGFQPGRGSDWANHMGALDPYSGLILWHPAHFHPISRESHLWWEFPLHAPWMSSHSPRWHNSCPAPIPPFWECPARPWFALRHSRDAVSHRNAPDSSSSSSPATPQHPLSSRCADFREMRRRHALKWPRNSLRNCVTSCFRPTSLSA